MMHEYTATIRWSCDGEFAKGRYSRAHTWEFDGGITLPASASPGVVPLPYSDASAVDPEEAYVAAISSCHMLTFLDLIRRKGFLVTGYTDKAVGHMVNDDGTWWVSRVELDPDITWDGPAPDAKTLNALADLVVNEVQVGRHEEAAALGRRPQS